jgi:hypothetical protein
MANYRLRIGQPGPNTYTLVAAQGSYLLAGQVTNLSYVPVGSNSVTPSFTVNQSSGPAPLNVYFNAKATTTNVVKANQTANIGPWRTLEYSWDFGDPASGTWPISGLSRNSQVGGALAAHVFDNGTQVHTVTLTVKVGLPWRTNTNASPTQYIVDDLVRQNGNTYFCAVAHTPGVFATDLATGKWTLLQVGEISSSTTQNITVQSHLDATWAGGKYYVSSSGNFARAPSGWITQTIVPSVTVNNRVIWLRGDGDSYAGFDVQGTNIKVYGDPGNTTAPNIGRLRIGGTKSSVSRVNGSTGGQIVDGAVDCMYYNNTLSHTDPSSIVLYFEQVGSDTFQTIVRPWFVGNDCVDQPNSIAGIYGAGFQPVIMGNTAGWIPPYGADQQHSCRVYSWWELIVAHNWLKGGSTDGIRHALKLPSQGFVEWPTTSPNAYASEYCVVANNTFGNTQDNDDWNVDIGPQNDTHAEGIGYAIMENNTFINGTKTSTNILYTGKFMCMRGNTVSNAATLTYSMNAASQSGIPQNWRGPYLLA